MSKTNNKLLESVAPRYVAELPLTTRDVARLPWTELSDTF